MHRSVIATIVTVMLTLLGATAARAQAYPTGPVKVIFQDGSYNPVKHGGSADRLTWHWDNIAIDASTSAGGASVASSSVASSSVASSSVASSSVAAMGKSFSSRAGSLTARQPATNSLLQSGAAATGIEYFCMV